MRVSVDDENDKVKHECCEHEGKEEKHQVIEDAEMDVVRFTREEIFEKLPELLKDYYLD
jgi:hypothetical protein